MAFGLFGKKKIKLYIDGCSYSAYDWPSWADLIALSNKQVLHLAKSGSGNERIFFNLVSNLDKLDKNTKVLLQWSSFPRFDYFTNEGRWQSNGNVHYVESFMNVSKTWWTDEFAAYKTFNCVKAAIELLENRGIDFYMMTMDDWSLYKDVVPLNWQSIINHPRMLVHNLNDFCKDGEKYKYQAPWQDQAYVDDHPSIVDHFRIAEFLSPYLNVSLSEYWIERMEETHKKLVTATTREEIHEYSGNWFRTVRDFG